MKARNEKTMIRLLCCALPSSVLNITMFNVALPELAAAFQASPSAAAWIVTGFALIYAIGSLIYGKLADLFSIKRLLMTGIFIFGCGSVMGLFAFNFPMLLAARFVQAVGASCFPAMAMQIPARFVAGERRGEALGIVSATLALSGGFGPILGGWITEWLHWRYLFLISLGAVFTLPFIHRRFPREFGKKGRIDLAGAGLLGLSAAALMLSVTQADLRLLAAGIALLAVFLFQQRRAVQPFLPPLLFRNRRYNKGLMMGALSSSTNIGITLLTPLALHHVYGFHAGMIGLIMFPGAMSAALLGKTGGKLADRRGNHFVMMLAIALLSGGLLALSGAVGAWPWLLAACLIAANTGSNFMQTALAKRMSAVLATEHVGIGMGIFGLANFLSVGLFGTVVTKAAEQAAFLLPGSTFTHDHAAVFRGIYVGLCVLPLLVAGMLFSDRKAKFRPGSHPVGAAPSDDQSDEKDDKKGGSPEVRKKGELTP